ncbi:MAG: LTA synthase family protein [Alphaproteobacteria bacterium]|nr:LTA synthase family protein [Alphaproteobacteria bacterium]
MRPVIAHNHYLLKRLSASAVIFFALQLLLRLAFLMRESANIAFDPEAWIQMFVMGIAFDVTAFSFLMLPYVLYLVLLPRRWHLGKTDAALTAACHLALIYALLFDVLAEWIFWDEFSVRFNFIAVDYLVYTHEVLANIWESYSVVGLLLAVTAITLGIFYYVRRMLLPDAASPVAGFSTRASHGALYLLIPVALFATLDLSRSEVSTNSYLNEITQNGVYSLFSAFRNNELNYAKFYLTAYDSEPLPAIRELLEEEEMGQRFVSNDPDDITRFVPGNGPEKHKNVVLVVMESMSAEYMERFGNHDALTPHLDALAKQSLFFSDLYATGTRTVRGLEAIALSIPPSPGQSIVKRPGNENLASIGFVFRDRGYDTKFIYGGYGYFDNMNYFFGNNGFDIVDRANFSADETTFANAWGLCDEDLFRKVIAEGNRSHAAHRPFMHLVMTTSNHRPYTFPAGRGDIPAEGGGRSAGVRYADYAVGKFLEDARKQPWFDDTVFLFIADHTAGSAGKNELDVSKYHIPLFIYAPSFIAPREVASLTSQIDVAPILLGLLDFTYISRFYGENVLEDPDEQAHAFISNYQKLGFIANDTLVILKPGKAHTEYRGGERVSTQNINPALLRETISFFAHAAGWKKHMARIDTRP